MFVEVRQLRFGYRGEEPLFEGFSFGVEKGDAVSIIGPSGCGKSTLLYLIAGLLHPDPPGVFIDGGPVLRPRPRTGLVLQDHGLLPWATVRDNLRLGLKIRRFYGPDGTHAPEEGGDDDRPDGGRVDFWLDRLGIGSLADRYPAQLSRGQRQRTAIGRTLVLAPDLLLLDEPFSALDVPTREDLQRTVLQLRREHRLTSVIVTHDIDEAVRMGRTILVLQHHTNEDATVIDNPAFAGDGPGDRAPAAEITARLRAILSGTP